MNILLLLKLADTMSKQMNGDGLHLPRAGGILGRGLRGGSSLRPQAWTPLRCPAACAAFPWGAFSYRACVTCCGGSCVRQGFQGLHGWILLSLGPQVGTLASVCSPIPCGWPATLPNRAVREKGGRQLLAPSWLNLGGRKRVNIRL